MKCGICGKNSLFEFCLDCQTDNQTLLTLVKSLKEKIKNLAQERCNLAGRCEFFKEKKG